MFCAPLRPGTTAQVWPGNAVDIFSTANSNVAVSVVSTFSNFLNFERWYFSAASATAADWDSELTFKPGLPQRTNRAGEPVSMEFAESYIDRAVLMDPDWRSYIAPLPWIPGYQWETYSARLTPVRLEQSGQVIFGEPVDVWVQFWRLGNALNQIFWYIDGNIRWDPPTATGLPSAFVIPENGGSFHRTARDNVPRAGFMYSGGLRPAPWPGG